MRIADIFVSLQGEGPTSGYPTTFIRLAGCNLACSYCDTPESRIGGDELSIEEVVKHVSAKKPQHVCITGGEPLLQKADVALVAHMLICAGKKVTIETNGTIPFDDFPDEIVICMDVKCPSSGYSSDLSLLPTLKKTDAVKFVVETDEDLAFTEHIIYTHEIKAEIFISPVYGADYIRIASYILSKNLPARMQLQLHKFIGLP